MFEKNDAGGGGKKEKNGRCSRRTMLGKNKKHSDKESTLRTARGARGAVAGCEGLWRPRGGGGAPGGEVWPRGGAVSGGRRSGLAPAKLMPVIFGHGSEPMAHYFGAEPILCSGVLTHSHLSTIPRGVSEYQNSALERDCPLPNYRHEGHGHRKCSPFPA